MKSVVLCSFAFLSCICLFGCGVKGPLYQPNNNSNHILAKNEIAQNPISNKENLKIQN